MMVSIAKVASSNPAKSIALGFSASAFEKQDCILNIHPCQPKGRDIYYDVSNYFFTYDTEVSSTSKIKGSLGTSSMFYI